MDGEPTLIIINEDYIVAKIADTDEIEVELPFHSLGTPNKYLYSELAYYLASAAQRNTVETQTRKDYEKGATISKTDWKGST